MSKIKTREKGKDIKVLDKSAMIGQRMKSAFIRSKRNAEALLDNRQAKLYLFQFYPAAKGLTMTYTYEYLHKI